MTIWNSPKYEFKTNAGHLRNETNTTEISFIRPIEHSDNSNNINKERFMLQ
jgi:hypothetical protein